MATPCRVLLVYPKFISDSFWNYADACKLVGASYPAAPLGLITVAAMLPKDWDVRLVNRNTEELTGDDLAWADLVMTGGMLNQQPDTLELMKTCRALGKPVCVGGPDVTSSPHVYADADIQVLGEAEHIITDFIAAWQRGERSGIFTAEKFKIDVTQSPIPRYDLLKLDQYLYIGVQFSRGCPFTCEFCDIIELYGRVPRTKDTPQILRELDALYALGYRGHVDFVDDNLIGNKKNLKLFLPKLKDWMEAHDYPFEFSTEASINLADDDELLQQMKEANFFAVFVGIESPDPETLKQMRKKQNTKRNIAECVHKIYSYGMFVTAGFIVGFDTEKMSMSDSMAEFIEDCAIPVCMVGLLYALPNTQLTRRLAKEGRLHNGHDVMNVSNSGDQCMIGINFEPARPMSAVLSDYKRILERVYDPVVYAERLRRLATMLDRSGRRRELPAGDKRRGLGTLETLYKIINAVPGTKEIFWNVFTEVAKKNPDALRYIVFQMAIYMHLGPFSKHVANHIGNRLAALDETAMPPPAQIQAAAAVHA